MSTWIDSINMENLRLRLAAKIGEDPTTRFKFYVFEPIKTVVAISAAFAQMSGEHYAWTSETGWISHDGKIKF